MWGGGGVRIIGLGGEVEIFFLIRRSQFMLVFFTGRATARFDSFTSRWTVRLKLLPALKKLQGRMSIMERANQQ
jgi:hypothetical protein